MPVSRCCQILWFLPSEPVEHRACCQVLLDAKTCNGRMSSHLVVCLQVRDIAFLHRYNEPTLLILHEVIALGLQSPAARRLCLRAQLAGANIHAVLTRHPTAAVTLEISLSAGRAANLDWAVCGAQRYCIILGSSPHQLDQTLFLQCGFCSPMSTYRYEYLALP